MMQTKYSLGHSENEIERLMFQATMLGPITERLLRGAGIGPGMRVLDIGCGAGDVSMLAAQLVGPSGSVVGIDCSPQVIAVANKRAHAGGLRQVTFKDIPLENFSDPEPFDCVVGRYVLVHQADPANFLRAAARFARPGGIIAFHETDITGAFKSRPKVRRWDIAGSLLVAAFRRALPHSDSPQRMIELFSDAGLPVPSLRKETLVGGGAHSPLYAWLVGELQSLWPQIVEMGIAPEGSMLANTLESKLRSAVVEARSQIEGPPQVCAWARF